MNYNFNIYLFLYTIQVFLLISDELTRYSWKTTHNLDEVTSLANLFFAELFKHCMQL